MAQNFTQLDTTLHINKIRHDLVIFTTLYTTIQNFVYFWQQYKLAQDFKNSTQVNNTLQTCTKTLHKSTQLLHSSFFRKKNRLHKTQQTDLQTCTRLFHKFTTLFTIYTKTKPYSTLHNSTQLHTYFHNKTLHTSTQLCTILQHSTQRQNFSHILPYTLHNFTKHKLVHNLLQFFKAFAKKTVTTQYHTIQNHTKQYKAIQTIQRTQLLQHFTHIYKLYTAFHRSLHNFYTTLHNFTQLYNTLHNFTQLQNNSIKQYNFTNT